MSTPQWITDRHGKPPAAMANRDAGAAGQEAVSRAHAPVAVGAAAVGRPAAVPAVVDGGGHRPAVASAVVREDRALSEQGKGKSNTTHSHVPGNKRLGDQGVWGPTWDQWAVSQIVRGSVMGWLSIQTSPASSASAAVGGRW